MTTISDLGLGGRGETEDVKTMWKNSGAPSLGIQFSTRHAQLERLRSERERSELTAFSLKLSPFGFQSPAGTLAPAQFLRLENWEGPSILPPPLLSLLFCFSLSPGAVFLKLPGKSLPQI